MIYMKAVKLHIVVLETGNLDELKKGHPATTPDNEVFICWTPDPVWLADKLLDCDGDGAKIAELINEASKRPQKPNRPYHENYANEFRRGKNDLSPGQGEEP
jgi:hypothetical protein